MTVRYVDGVAGNDGYNGLAPEFDGVNGPKATLNGVEDTPVVAGDLVHIKAGVYREMLTVDVSGGAGSPVEYRGDYAGAVWPGAGGVVRITGSDNDQTAARASCIIDAGTQRNYRTFRGFELDTTSSSLVLASNAGTNWNIDQCALLMSGGANGLIRVSGANQAAWAISNCYIDYLGSQDKGFFFLHAATVDNTGHVIENCIIRGHGHVNSAGFRIDRIGGITIRNCNIANVRMGIGLSAALAAGQTLTVNNCLVTGCDLALWAIAADGSFVENYNNLYNNTTDRTNVGVGANSTAYTPLFDTRWFFEMVNGGNLVTPFDLGAWSQLINVAGTNPPATDMRGTGTVGAQREWGPLEYDPSLLIAGGGGGVIRRAVRMIGG